MLDINAKESARIAAATVLLDRSWGKAEQAMHITTVEPPIHEWSTLQLTSFLKEITITSQECSAMLIDGENKSSEYEKIGASD